MRALDRASVTELHFITPIANIPSIMSRGILSNASSTQIHHLSIAMDSVQQKRAKKSLPNGRALHQHANLYFHARNPMLYVRKDQHRSLAVLRVSAAVIDLPGVFTSDQNAASDYARFREARLGLDHIDADFVFAEYWTSPDPIEKFRRTSAKCAEVLVPDVVAPGYILGAYVSGPEAAAAVQQVAPTLPLTMLPGFFFL